MEVTDQLSNYLPFTIEPMAHKLWQAF